MHINQHAHLRTFNCKRERGQMDIFRPGGSPARVRVWARAFSRGENTRERASERERRRRERERNAMMMMLRMNAPPPPSLRRRRRRKAMEFSQIKIFRCKNLLVPRVAFCRHVVARLKRALM